MPVLGLVADPEARPALSCLPAPDCARQLQGRVAGGVVSGTVAMTPAFRADFRVPELASPRRVAGWVVSGIVAMGSLKARLKGSRGPGWRKQRIFMTSGILSGFANSFCQISWSCSGKSAEVSPPAPSFYSPGCHNSRQEPLLRLVSSSKTHRNARCTVINAIRIKAVAELLR